MQTFRVTARLGPRTVLVTGERRPPSGRRFIVTDLERSYTIERVDAHETARSYVLHVASESIDLPIPGTELVYLDGVR